MDFGRFRECQISFQGHFLAFDTSLQLKNENNYKFNPFFCCILQNNADHCPRSWFDTLCIPAAVRAIFFSRRRASCRFLCRMCVHNRKFVVVDPHLFLIESRRHSTALISYTRRSHCTRCCLILNSISWLHSRTSEWCIFKIKLYAAFIMFTIIFHRIPSCSSSGNPHKKS